MAKDKKTETKPDYDSPWKEAIERFFPNFMHFFFPHIHKELDWSKKAEFLDKELEKAVREAKVGRRYADKLIKVFLINGQSKWVLIHVAVQSSRETGFEERMYLYHHRIWEKYKVDVVSLAILCDDEENYRPNQYKTEMWGCGLNFKFPIVKLLDYANDWVKLERNDNPFAMVVMTQVKSKKIKDGQQRKYWKTRLSQMLYERAYEKQDILELYRFIDWILVLPEALEKEHLQESSELEKEKNMQYVTNAERFGEQRGIQIGEQRGIQIGEQRGILNTAREAIVNVSVARFGEEAKQVETTLSEIADSEKLEQLLIKAATVQSLNELFQLIETKH